MYADDSDDAAPRTPLPADSFAVFVDGLAAFKKLMANSSNSNLFICPADIFYYSFEANAGGGYVCYVPQGFRVLNQEVVANDQIILHLYVQGKEREDTFKMKKVGNEWKLNQFPPDY